jgi:hypothetical protein
MKKIMKKGVRYLDSDSGVRKEALFENSWYQKRA